MERHPFTIGHRYGNYRYILEHYPGKDREMWKVIAKNGILTLINDRPQIWREKGPIHPILWQVEGRGLKDQRFYERLIWLLEAFIRRLEKVETWT